MCLANFMNERMIADQDGWGLYWEDRGGIVSCVYTVLLTETESLESPCRVGVAPVCHGGDSEQCCSKTWHQMQPSQQRALEGGGGGGGGWSVEKV